MPVVLLIAIVIVAFFAILYFVPINTWITAVFSGVKIDLMELVFMRIRKTPVDKVVNALISSHKAGFPISKNDLEVHALARGDVEAATDAYISLRKGQVEISFAEVANEDLEGKNLNEFVQARKNASGQQDLRKEICRMVLQKLNDQQVTEVKNYLDRLN